LLADAGFVAHLFRMSLFFFIAGYFARLMYHKLGARGFWSNRAMRIGVPLVVGWVVLVPLVFAIWGMGMNKMAERRAAAADARGCPSTGFPLTHLWFLYQLLVLRGVIAVRTLIVRFDGAQKLRCVVDGALTSAIRLPLVCFVFGLPLARRSWRCLSGLLDRHSDARLSR
jgi:hypothetical protein